jgi:hypothetical protein
MKQLHGLCAQTFFTFRTALVFHSKTHPELLTYVIAFSEKDKGKGKAVPLQAWSGPEGSRKLRFPDFMTTVQGSGNSKDKAVPSQAWSGPECSRKLGFPDFMTTTQDGGNSKDKAVPLQAWSGPECSRKLRFPDFITTAQDGGKVVSLTHRPPLPPGNTPDTLLCWRLSRPHGHSATGRIMSLKNSNDTIGNRTRDLKVCSVVP